ncbi:DUF4920 domain-containing protein [Longimonas halophila]|uniref:DUF4920 domain-containing protein n=2 Tax=Longimonas halophila TaxID=1469170 RepID=A0A2H3NRT3_9BACT|nr:DUF4920 domain-containing protein [Longimonas halophila]
MAGCASGDTAPDAPSQTTHGAAVDAGSAVPVQRVAASPAQFADQTVVLEGRVSAVCERKGCWLALSTGADTPPLRVEVARTDAGEYAFTVPTTASGWAAVQGRLVAQSPPSHDGHGDGAEAPKSDAAANDATGSSYHLIADGVRLTASDG